MRRENRSSQRWVRAVAAFVRTARPRLSSHTMAISSDSITLLWMLWLIPAADGVFHGREVVPAAQRLLGNLVQEAEEVEPGHDVHLPDRGPHGQAACRR